SYVSSHVAHKSLLFCIDFPLYFTYLACLLSFFYYFFFSSRRRHTRSKRDWSSDVCSSDLRQRRLLGLCRSYGLRLLGPNCLGLLNAHPDNRLNASLSTRMPPHGRVGFFSQSGALGAAILESVGRRGLGLSSFVSAGNRADVSGNDLLQYWSEDDDTEVVLLYFESIGNPRKFSRIARGVAAKKPVVAVKSGRSTQGVPVGHAVRQTSAPQA